MTKKNAKKTAARALQAAHGGKYNAHLRQVGGGGNIEIIQKTRSGAVDNSPLRLGAGTSTSTVPLHQLTVELVNAGRTVWRRVHDRLRTLFVSEFQFMPIDFDSESRVANGGMPASKNVLTMTKIAARATAVMQQEAANLGASHEIDGWAIHVLNPGECKRTKTITIVAVDPDGIGHDISELAK